MRQIKRWLEDRKAERERLAEAAKQARREEWNVIQDRLEKYGLTQSAAQRDPNGG